MKVLLVIPSLDVPKFKGVAKSSSVLLNGLKKYVDLEVFEVYRNDKISFANLTLTPLKELISKANIIHAHVPESAAFFGIIKRFKKIRTVVNFHDLSPIRMPYELSFKFPDLTKFYTSLMWKGACSSDAIVVNSTDTAEEIETFFGRRADYIITPGVDEKCRPINVKKDKLTLGFFSNFSLKKRVDVAIKVFKILKEKIDCKLIIAGGSMQTVYQRQFDVVKLTEGLASVELLDYVPEEKVAELYNSFDYFLYPSIYEGFGIPILEAQACGVITFVMSDAKIPQEAKAKAVKCSSPEEIANKILYFLGKRNEDKRLREEGIRYASGFSWENYVQKHLEVYEKLTNSSIL